MTDNKKEKEIDLFELVNILWGNKKFIIKVSLVGVIIGVIIAFSIPKEYSTTIVFVTNSKQAPSGSMGALASLAGINIGGEQSSDIYSSDLYPTLIYSTPFIQGLLDINVKDQTQNIDTSLYCYLKDKQKKAWWNHFFCVLKFFKLGDDAASEESKINPYFISGERLNIIESFKSLCSINTDKKTGVTTLSINTQSPSISALLADTLTTYLQEYIIKERTKKAKTDLQNTEKLYEQAKIGYNEIQQKLATFVDANQNITSAKYRIRQDKLEHERSLAYSMYTQMAQQLQIDKLKIQNDTPVFTIIQPSIEALSPIKPNKKIIIITFSFFSLLGACLWSLKKEFSKLI